MIIKLFKFITVGFSGLIIDFFITFYLKEKLKINKFAANSLGFSAAATSNYILNRIWTFNSNNPEILHEFSLFFIISIIGLIINNYILWLIINKSQLNFYISKLIAIIITTIWNFSANFLITF